MGPKHTGMKSRVDYFFGMPQFGRHVCYLALLVGRHQGLGAVKTARSSEQRAASQLAKLKSLHRLAFFAEYSPRVRQSNRMLHATEIGAQVVLRNRQVPGPW
jgi:hypothetical protein